MVRKNSVGDWIFDIAVIIVMLVVVFSTLYPFINSLAISLNDSDDTTKGGITFYPRVFTIRNYELIFQNPNVYRAYIITIARTVLGTLGGLLFTSLFAFGMASENL
jgi:putative aldouronate transport system permease protein